MAELNSGDRQGDFGGAVHRRGRGVVWVESAADTCVVADTRDFRQFELNGTSSQLWRRFDGDSRDLTIVADVLLLYPDHPDTAAEDCLNLIAELEQLRLLDSNRPEPGDVMPSNGRRGL
jgi:hypothetical protein